MRAGNPMLNQLSIQQSIAKQQLRIDQSGYLPDIALFGKQTLYAHGIQSNLVPRTMVGIGFTRNLFDGLAREKRIRQSRIAEQTLALGKEKAQDDLSVGIDKLYTGLQKARDNVRALNSTIALSEELVRIRKKSFCRRYGNQYRGSGCRNHACYRQSSPSGRLLRIRCNTHESTGSLWHTGAI